MGAFITIMMPSLSCMYFLKLKIEVNNKAIQLTLIKKNPHFSINKDGLSYLGPLECKPLGSQMFTLNQCPFSASGPEPKQRLDTGMEWFHVLSNLGLWYLFCYMLGIEMYSNISVGWKIQIFWQRILLNLSFKTFIDQ